MVLKHQTLHNAIFNTSSWIFSILLSFAFLPYIVHQLGTEAYGVLVLILAVIGYFALLDLNLGNAVIKYVAEYHAEGDLKKINDIVRTTIFIYLFLGALGGLSIFALSSIITTQFLKIQEELLPAAQSAMNIGALGFFFTILLSALSAIPNGLNRYDITSKFTMVITSITTLATAFLLYLGSGLKDIVILNVSLSFLGVLCYIYICKKLLPGLRLTPAFDYLALKKILNFGLFSSLSRISGLIQFQADRLLIGAILGASWVTYYVVPFSLIRRIMTITARIGGVIFPVVSGLQGGNDFASIKSLYLQSSRLILTIATALCLPLILFGDRFLGLWMGEQFEQKAGIVILLLTVSLYLDAFTNVPSIVVDGLGRPKITGLFALANAIINLTLIYPLGKIMGIIGISLSFFISHVCVVPAFVYYVNNRILRFSVLKLIKDVYFLPLFSAVLTALPLLFVPEYKIDNLFYLLCIMIMTTILYILISGILGVFTKAEKKQCLEYLHFIFSRVETIDRNN